MFLLMQINFEDHDVIGVFNTTQAAKDYAQTALNREGLNWSEPNRVGAIWANSHGGSLHISPVAVNPTAYPPL